MGLGSFFKRDKQEVSKSHIEISDECGGCGKCVTACPNNVLILDDGRSAVNNDFACKRCKICVAICNNQCITVN